LWRAFTPVRKAVCAAPFADVGKVMEPSSPVAAGGADWAATPTPKLEQASSADVIMVRMVIEQPPCCRQKKGASSYACGATDTIGMLVAVTAPVRPQKL
jgi:hypothetical protein